MDRDPFVAVIGDGTRGIVVAVLRPADILGDIAHVDEAIGIKLRPVVDRHHDVGACPGLEAEVMRACTPSPLMVSTVSEIPSAFRHS
jgi:hypothetical protein